MKRKAVYLLLVLALLAFGISSGWVFNGHSSADEEPTVTLTMPQIVLNDIVLRYGEAIKVMQGPDKVTGEYITYIQDGQKLRAVLWLNGLMVEVASAPLQGGNTTQ